MILQTKDLAEFTLKTKDFPPDSDQSKGHSPWLRPDLGIFSPIFSITSCG